MLLHQEYRNILKANPPLSFTRDKRNLNANCLLICQASWEVNSVIWLTLWILAGCITIYLEVGTQILWASPSCLSCLCFLDCWIKNLVNLCDWAGQDCQFTGRCTMSHVGWKHACTIILAQQKWQGPRLRFLLVYVLLKRALRCDF